MKTIGYTEDGGLLVEMNRQEHHEFVSLQRAVEGGVCVIDYSPTRSLISGFDFSKTFEVIRAYYEHKFCINEIQNHLDQIKSAIEKK